MSLIKWEPFDDFDRVFRDLSFPQMKMQNMSFDLAADVYEDGSTVVAEMNLPGLTADNIDVEVENNHLRVSGRREEVDEKKEKDHYTKEIRRGSFERVLPLPCEVKQTEVTAKYKDGVLRVTMPKKEEEKEQKVKIEIE